MRGSHSFFRYMLKFSKVYSGLLVLSILATIVTIVSNVVVSEMIRNIIDTTIQGSFINIYMLFVCILAFVIGLVSTYMMRYVSGKYSSNTLKDIREALIEHLEELPITFTKKHKVGDILSRMSNDVNVLQNYLEKDWIEVLYVPFMIAGFSVYLCYLNWKLFLVSFILLPILIPLSVKLMKPIKELSKRNSKFLGEVSHLVHDAANGIHIVKSYQLESEMTKKYDEKLNEALDITIKNDTRQYLIEPVSSFISKGPFVLCLVYGGYLCFAEELSLGSFVAFLTLFKMLIDPLMSGYLLIINSKTAIAAGERIFSLFEEEQEHTYSRASMQLTMDKKTNDGSAVEFESVSFGYEQDHPVLRNVSFTVNSGEMLAIVGSSGSGKTTIFNLICRLFLANSGKIRINNKEIGEVNVKELREQISYVPQSSFLFPISVLENIQIGRKDATRDEIIEAAKLSNAHDFIMELPNGYDTLLGERGVNISGGQIQRIAIARALIKRTSILLFDEATSALDTQSEKLIVETLERLHGVKTVIIIAHRLSTIKQADKIIAMENGEITEVGGFEDLVRRNEAFRFDYQDA